MNKTQSLPPETLQATGKEEQINTEKQDLNSHMLPLLSELYLR